MGIFRSTTGGKFIEVNPALAKMLGYNSPKEVLDNIYNIAEQIYVKTNHRKEIVDDTLEINSVTHYENVYRRKNGEHFIANLFLRSIQDGQGNHLYLEGMVEEITERKEKERVIKENEEKIKYILKYNPNAIAVFDNKLHYLIVSDRYLKDYNVKDENIIGKHHYEVFPEIPEKWRQIHKRVLNGEILKNDDDYFERQDGSITYNRWECRPWYHSDGLVGGMITYTEVITPRKKAELKLKESREELRQAQELMNTILDSMSEMFAFYKDEELEIYWANAAAGVSVNKSKEEIINVKCYKLWHGLETPCENCPVLKTFETKEPQETVVQTPDMRYFQIRSYPVFSNCNVFEGVIEYGRDITEKRIFEQALIKSEKELRELNKTKDRLFSIIAHDLKTPVIGLMNLTQMLKNEINSGNYENVKEYSEILFNSSKKGFDLLQNLLEWARTQIGGIKFSPKRFKLCELVKEIIELFLDYAKSKSIEIICEIPEQTYIFADESMMKTVVRNLISNALKFTKENGKIILTPPQFPGQILFSVKDDGVGIKKDHITKLFKLDENFSTYGTNNEKGTGLGLILCKDFVEKHGGDISVQSKVNKGTTFTVTMPQ